MNADSFEALRKKACELHALQPAREKQKVSVDAVFVALANTQAISSKKAARESVRRQSNAEPPDWFKDTLKHLKGKGEAMTVSRFLMLAGKFPADRSDALGVGRWLRDAGYTPRKTGGNLLFDL